MNASLQSDGRTVVVRRGSLVDVTVVARLMEELPTLVDVDGDGIPDQVSDPFHAASATRIMLSHAVLERGELWVAEEAGQICAAAVWMPGADPDALLKQVSGVIARELGPVPIDDPGPHIQAWGSILDPDLPAVPTLVLVGLVVAKPVPAAEHESLLKALLTPVIERADAPDSALAALAVEPDRIALLQLLGMVEQSSIVLTSERRLWMGYSRGAAEGREAAAVEVAKVANAVAVVEAAKVVVDLAEGKDSSGEHLEPA